MNTGARDTNHGTQYLRDMLSRSTDPEDLPEIVRELAHIVIDMGDDLSTLPAVRKEISELNLHVLQWMDAQVEVRHTRTKREAAVAQVTADLLKEEESITDKFRTILKEQIKAVRETTPAFTWWVWLRDKVLPGPVGVLLVAMITFIFTAIMFYTLYLAGLRPTP